METRRCKHCGSELLKLNEVLDAETGHVVPKITGDKKGENITKVLKKALKNGDWATAKGSGVSSSILTISSASPPLSGAFVIDNQSVSASGINHLNNQVESTLGEGLEPSVTFDIRECSKCHRLDWERVVEGSRERYEFFKAPAQSLSDLTRASILARAKFKH